jgi:hypothetical protein
MEFTYKIENYIQSEKRLFVVYTPTDTALPAWGNWVQINDDMTEAQIKERVVESLPTYRWANTEIAAAKNLVAHSEVATFVYVPEPEPEVTVFPEPTQEEIERARRNRLLFISDWAVLPDAPLTDAKKEEYLVYRQALRDVPEQSGFPDTIVWPTKP